MTNAGWAIRRSFLIGLALACALAAFGAGLAWRASGEHRASDAYLRLQMVRLASITQLVERAGGAGDAVRRIVAESDAKKSFEAFRVVAFDGLSLEASTAAADVGERVAPRRLEKDEKPLYDQGQRLRAAVDTNREEGAARKGEIEVAARPGGGWTLALPVEVNGAVSGVVQADLAALGAETGWTWPTYLLVFALPVLLLLLLSPVIGERRWLLLALSAVGLLGAAWAWQQHTHSAIASKAARDAETLAVAASEARTQADSLIASLGLPADPPLDPSQWDRTEYRQPRGLLTNAARVDKAVLDREVDALATTMGRLGTLGASGALVLLAFVGLGGAASLWQTLRRNREAYSFVTPAMLGMLVLVFFPFFYGIALSFTDANLYNSDKSIADTWIGMRNFTDILSDYHLVRSTDEGWVFNYDNFYYTLIFTILWTVFNVAIGVGLGLILALMLNTKGLALRPIYRVLLILPWAMPNYITALIWKGMFHQQFGVVNQIIQIFGGTPLAWFDHPWSSFAAVLATNGWLSFPFMMVVSLGALQSISAELYEAARVDGAGRWQQFRAITLPSLKPALVPAVILSVIWTFNMFNIIYLVSQGQPSSSTEILITQAYKIAFEKYRYGYAAAYSTVIFLLLLVYGTMQNRLSRGTEAA